MTKKFLFVDMDGTLAEWKTDKTEKDTYKKGYFYNLKPYPSVLAAVKEIVEVYFDEIKVCILSHYQEDNEYALKEKREWLDKYLPDVLDRFFIPCGHSKAGPFHIDKDCYLLDDYKNNLDDWEKHQGTPIKLVNGINSPDEKIINIDKDTPSEAIVLSILEAMNYLEDCVVLNAA